MGHPVDVDVKVAPLSGSRALQWAVIPLHFLPFLPDGRDPPGNPYRLVVMIWIVLWVNALLHQVSGLLAGRPLGQLPHVWSPLARLQAKSRG